jgi:hypothetical protein
VNSHWNESPELGLNDSGILPLRLRRDVVDKMDDKQSVILAGSHGRQLAELPISNKADAVQSVLRRATFRKSAGGMFLEWGLDWGAAAPR